MKNKISRLFVIMGLYIVTQFSVLAMGNEFHASLHTLATTYSCIFSNTNSLSNELVFYNSTLSNPEVYIYPNPVNETLYFENLYNIKSIIICDITGAKIFETSDIYEEKMEIEVSHFKKGLFFINIIYYDGKTEGIKIIKN